MTDDAIREWAGKTFNQVLIKLDATVLETAARELLALQREVQELSASGYGHKLWISPFLGRFITFHVDPNVPEDEVHIRDHNGKLLSKITHVGHNT